MLNTAGCHSLAQKPPHAPLIHVVPTVGGEILGDGICGRRGLATRSKVSHGIYKHVCSRTAQRGLPTCSLDASRSHAATPFALPPPRDDVTATLLTVELDSRLTEDDVVLVEVTRPREALLRFPVSVYFPFASDSRPRRVPATKARRRKVSSNGLLPRFARTALASLVFVNVDAAESAATMKSARGVV